MTETVLSIMMLGVIALVIGAIVMLRKGGPKTKPVMMLVLAAVLAGNLALLLVPNERGLAPALNAIDE